MGHRRAFSRAARIDVVKARPPLRTHPRVLGGWWGPRSPRSAHNPNIKTPLSIYSTSGIGRSVSGLNRSRHADDLLGLASLTLTPPPPGSGRTSAAAGLLEPDDPFNKKIWGLPSFFRSVDWFCFLLLHALLCPSFHRSTRELCRFDSIDCIVFNPKAALGTTRGQRHPSLFDLIQIYLSAEESLPTALRFGQRHAPPL